MLHLYIEAYIYSILGAQARAKQFIVGERASSLVVKQIFRQIVEDPLINYDTSSWMNNVNLNLAVSPSLWLLPSNLIILETPISGYNKLRIATTNVKFGSNTTVNYFGSIHNQAPSHYLEKLKNNTTYKY